MKFFASARATSLRKRLVVSVQGELEVSLPYTGIAVQIEEVRGGESGRQTETLEMATVAIDRAIEIDHGTISITEENRRLNLIPREDWG